MILTFCNRGCPHITAAAGGEGFVNADVSRGEGKSIIILPDVIVCGQLQNRDLLRTYVCFNWNFSAPSIPPHCVFLNVSSNCLNQWMHNCTGCISLTFLNCASSNVSSSCLPERMYNHTGCICLTFLRCVFSCGPSKNLGQCMQSRTGCICLTFLHCVSSNVS